MTLQRVWEYCHTEEHRNTEAGMVVGYSGRRAVVAEDPLDVTQSVRSDLREIFGRIMMEARLNQTQAAKVCCTDQPTLSKVLSGRSDSVSTDQLIRWLVQLGCKVEINVQGPDALTFGVVKATLHE